MERPNETLKREIMEEVGVDVDDYSLLDVTSVNIKWEMEKDLWEDLHHIGILYKVSISDLNLKGDADGLDSDGASWYSISNLKSEEMSPFAKYGIEMLGYKLK